MLYDTEACKRSMDNAKRTIASLEISETNRKTIFGFLDSCSSEGLSPRRVLKYHYTIAGIARRLSKDFEKVNRADIEQLIGKMEQSDYSHWTKHDYRVTLKKFFRWLRQTEEYPPEVKWLRSTIRNNHAKLPEEILTPQEVQSIIAAATTPRDRALIASLYESGCRIGELLGLQMKHIQQHPHGFQITVTGKTGSRRVLLIACAPYLSEWLNQHPRREDPQSPVWATSDHRAGLLCYGRVSAILRKTARRAGVTKAVNPHNFRHSRATHLANHLTEAQMKEYFGWVQGSDMASTYVHLSGRDIDSALLKLNNIQTSETNRQVESFSLRLCPRCRLENPPANKFCSRCGMVLDEQAAHELIKATIERKETDEIMDRLIQDQRFREILRRMIAELATASSDRCVIQPAKPLS